MPSRTPDIYSIGHSTRTMDEFVRLLRAHGIERLVDVRTIPRSRHNPQFDRATLARALRNRRFAYCHMKSLGGLRHAAKDSVNMGWHNSGFRGFADYMQTPLFAKSLDRLIALSREKRTAFMCAEAVPWRCHRSLLSDALTVRGLHVGHIQSASAAPLHHLNPMARVSKGKITYPLDAPDPYVARVARTISPRAGRRLARPH